MITAKKPFSPKLMREHFAYDPDSGEIRRKTQGSGATKPGELTGWVNARGYRAVCFRRQSMLAHRLAWCLHHGRWPKGVIDHLNGDTADNRMSNLRDCTQQENVRRALHWSHNTSGVKGVSYDTRREYWRAYIQIDGRYIDLGRHASRDAAATARKEAEIRFFKDSSV